MSQKESQASCSNGPEDPSISPSHQPPYSDRLLGILLARDSISVSEAAMRNFDKQVLTSIHDSARIYLANPDVGNIMVIQGTPEEVQQVTDECTEAADELVALSLKDLKQGKRNECVVLYGELCVEPFQFGRIYTVLEEMGTGNAVALSIFSDIDQSFAGKNYPKGSKIAVKEPRLVQAERGLVFVEVNNPLCIETVSSSLPTPHADLNVRVSRESFGYWMDCASKAFEAKEWEKCIRTSTKCEVIHSKLRTTVDEVYVYNMYVMRWVSRMYVQKYAEALSDAESCCKLDAYHSGGFQAQIQSLLSVGRYQDAFRFLEHFCGLEHFNEDEKKVFTSTYRRFGESYFHMGDAIIEGAGPGAHRPRLCKQDGDFIGPVEIRMTSNDCGRGLFATENIETGRVVLISKALALSYKPKEDPVSNGLLQNVKDALSSCGDKTLQLFLSHATCIPNHLSQFVPKMSDFFADKNDSPATATNCKNACAVTVGEIYEELVLHIIKRIAMGDSSPAAIQENGKKSVICNPVSNSASRLFYGVWLLVSFVNHSCAPNAARINVGEITRIHAAKPIEKGQEITIPYFSVLVPYSLREVSCKAFDFGCDCKCKRCEEERKIIQSEEPIYDMLCNEYLTAFDSSMEHRPDRILNGLVDQVEYCVKLLVDTNLVGNRSESEAWIRSSFMAVYFADEEISDEETLFTAARCGLETCPGDIQVVRFLQTCFLFYRGVAGNHLRFRRDIREVYEEYSRRAYQTMEEACFFVYGRQRKDVLPAIVKKLREEIF
ncbi:hypothetical protein KI387_040501 [Taxus chinensis]|uniref:SET domain-containing protein n=1 Tax=Taxus chinensis TaxID=29808 RepID=A0AA38F9W4_TAXCH|nr:hypothetical protein KI387_040501 [Taxus chinensis]